MATNSEEGTPEVTKAAPAAATKESAAPVKAPAKRRTPSAVAPKKAPAPAATKAAAPRKAAPAPAPTAKDKEALAKASHGAVKAKVALTKAAEDAVKAIKASRKEAARLPMRGGDEEETEESADKRKRMKADEYERAISGLQVEMVKLQEWIKFKGLKVVAVFEGRDAAGKGGCIKRITESLSPRVTKVVALPAPTEREKSQWYFQRYVLHLPAAGEMVLMDRSWYNRAGVEKVMGFCTPDEHSEFLRSCPEFERMLVRSGIILIKYWFSISNDEQERRFRKRIYHPTKHWKLSPMDLQSRARWVEYSKAKDEMFAHTDIKQAPWYVVHGDDKERARLNVMTHLLSLIDYEDLTPERIELPPRQEDQGYVRPPMSDQTFIPEIF
ncbi:MAG: polyphosphate kinase 2 [Dechloromonas sp.]|uniref:ADP/GDP-polyphosphate phosphotransferase n=1 Tax=Candidatus Dechloromonas phosphorivorans TaxID=2899244 RepID=A0A9D7LLZ8_9RHOO|nr:polyphosphate kinase 2 [Candidatus Dechloromonas phosphorivorans]